MIFKEWQKVSNTGFNMCLERSTTCLQKRESWLPGNVTPFIWMGGLCYGSNYEKLRKIDKYIYDVIFAQQTHTRCSTIQKKKENEFFLWEFLNVFLVQWWFLLNSIGKRHVTFWMKKTRDFFVWKDTWLFCMKRHVTFLYEKRHVTFLYEKRHVTFFVWK
jgi:hypothetical protein